VPLERQLDDGAVALARRQVAVVDVDPDDVPPVSGQPGRDRLADPARCAGDEGYRNACPSPR
jgi:hypothetical protein